MLATSPSRLSTRCLLERQFSVKKQRASSEQRKVTIHDIAREAGVSVATVSRTFSHPERVRAQTREQILAVSERRQFVADAMARSLARRRSGFLAVIIPTLYNSIYAASTQAIQSAGEAAGYTVLIGVSEFSKAREAHLVRQFIERRVEGLILTGADRDPGAQKMILRNRLPTVITWQKPARSATPWVSFDNYAAAVAVVDHLAVARAPPDRPCLRPHRRQRPRARATHGLRGPHEGAPPPRLARRHPRVRIRLHRGPQGRPRVLRPAVAADRDLLRQRHRRGRRALRVPAPRPARARRRLDRRVRRPAAGPVRIPAAHDGARPRGGHGHAGRRDAASS